jgi:endoglucanase
MKKLLLILLLNLFFSILKAQNTDLKPIRVKGNKFIDSDGREFVFRGVNIADPDNVTKQGHWNKAFFQEVKNWGANIVRIPIHPRTWQALGKEKYLYLIDQGVNWANEMGLYVIIDWHSIGNLRTEMYQSAGYETTRKETFEFWRTMANHYKGNNTVAFFELFNEPTTYKGQLGLCSWAEWKAMNEEMIGIIRANGGTAIPLIAGFNWAYDLSEIAKNPIKAEGIGYVSHPYPMKRPKPWEAQWTKDWGFVKDKYPLILTEIGFSLKDEPGDHIPVTDDGAYGDAITKYCDRKGISWVVWVFDQRWAPRMFSDWDFTPTTQGKYFKKAMLDRVRK